jgi:hypothetical protein
MHHTISYQLAQARMADLRHRVQSNALARAARKRGRRRRSGLRRWVQGRTGAMPGTAQSVQRAVANDAPAR